MLWEILGLGNTFIKNYLCLLWQCFSSLALLQWREEPAPGTATALSPSSRCRTPSLPLILRRSNEERHLLNLGDVHSWLQWHGLTMPRAAQELLPSSIWASFATRIELWWLHCSHTRLSEQLNCSGNASLIPMGWTAAGREAEHQCWKLSNLNVFKKGTFFLKIPRMPLFITTASKEDEARKSCKSQRGLSKMSDR